MNATSNLCVLQAIAAGFSVVFSLCLFINPLFASGVLVAFGVMFGSAIVMRVVPMFLTKYDAILTYQSAVVAFGSLILSIAVCMYVYDDPLIKVLLYVFLYGCYFITMMNVQTERTYDVQR